MYYEIDLSLLLVLKGNGILQGIMLDPPHPIRQEDWSDTAFKNMNCLRILIVRNTTFSSEPKHLPNRQLRLLDWEGYPSKSFPPKFHPKKIIVFNLLGSQLTLKEPFKVKLYFFFCFIFIIIYNNNYV